MRKIRSLITIFNIPTNIMNLSMKSYIACRTMLNIGNKQKSRLHQLLRLEICHSNTCTHRIKLNNLLKKFKAFFLTTETPYSSTISFCSTLDYRSNRLRELKKNSVLVPLNILKRKYKEMKKLNFKKMKAWVWFLFQQANTNLEILFNVIMKFSIF